MTSDQRFAAVGAVPLLGSNVLLPVYAVTLFSFKGSVSAPDKGIQEDYAWVLKEAVAEELHDKHRTKFVDQTWGTFWDSHQDGRYDVVYVEVEEEKDRPKVKHFYMQIRGVNCSYKIDPDSIKLRRRHSDTSCNGQDDQDCRREAARDLAKIVYAHDKASHSGKAHSP